MTADLHQLALYAYVATIALALVAEFCPVRRVALPSAVASIALSIIAGGSWCYSVYKQKYVFENSEFPARAAKRPAKEKSDQGGGGNGRGAQAQSGSGQGGGGDPEFEDGNGDGGSQGGGVSAGIAEVNRGIQSGADTLLEQIFPGRKSSDAAKAGRDVEGDIVRDCSTCPEMVIVAGGAQPIGASESDPAATAAEKPQRVVRFWPGFAISRNPISANDLAEFRSEAGRSSPVCAGPVGHVTVQSATCLYPEEADQYAAWLTARTGKRFRLPTAVEWEYAARVAGVTVLANNSANSGFVAVAAPLDGIGQDLAEFTSDCWTPYIPSAGNERPLWSSSALLCHELVLKGARPGESDTHTRFSARRPAAIGKPDWGVGFRVVRDTK